MTVVKEFVHVNSRICPTLPIQRRSEKYRRLERAVVSIRVIYDFFSPFGRTICFAVWVIYLYVEPLAFGGAERERCTDLVGLDGEEVQGVP